MYMELRKIENQCTHLLAKINCLYASEKKFFIVV